MKSLLMISALCMALIVPSVSNAQMWSFYMLDSSSNSVPGTLVITLNPVTQGAIPASTPLSINGEVYNSDSVNDLYISGFSVSSTQLQGSIDGQPFFTWNGETTPDTPSIPNWFGDQLLPSSNEQVNLGTFDTYSFLNSLPADGQAYSASLDFEISAADATGADFNPQMPSITPGPPSLLVTGQVNPAGGPIVPEPGGLAYLISAGAGVIGFVFRRR
jgi:hypothetical protein